MIGKIVNDKLTKPSEYEKKKLVITNPSDDILKFVLGYKDLIVDEEPEYDIQKQYLETVFEETENKIIQSWRVKEMPREEEVG